MPALDQRRTVVGADHQPVRLAGGFQCGPHRSHNFFVKVFNGAHLFLGHALVATLVGRFHVHIDEIGAPQAINRCLCLAGIVGVHPTGRARHGDYFQPAQFGKAAHQIHGGNHAALQTVTLGVFLQAHGLAKSPRPNLGGRTLPLGHAGAVDRMLRKNGL